MWDRGRFASYFLCFLIIQVKFSNSRTSWRLNADKVVKSTEFVPHLEDDPILDILTSSASHGNGQGWSKSSTPLKQEKLQVYCSECKGFVSGNHDR